MTGRTTADVVVVGGGVMGTAIASGLVADGWTRVRVVEPSADRRAELASVAGLQVVASATEITGTPEVIAVVVKPKIAATACQQIAPLIGEQTLVMSMCAGVPLGLLAEHLPGGTPVVRVMPNTPAQVGAGMSALSPNETVSPQQLDLATSLMQAVGETMIVPESLQDAVTAILPRRSSRPGSRSD